MTMRALTPVSALDPLQTPLEDPQAAVELLVATALLGELHQELAQQPQLLVVERALLLGERLDVPAHEETEEGAAEGDEQGSGDGARRLAGGLAEIPQRPEAGEPHVGHPGVDGGSGELGLALPHPGAQLSEHLGHPLGLLGSFALGRIHGLSSPEPDPGL